MGNRTGELAGRRVAVVGAGPAGLFAADELAARGARVDVFEKSFAPFGLLRSGVAPDHQEVKRLEPVLGRVFERPEVRFFGNVEFGVDVTAADLEEHYHEVVFAVGASRGKRLGIPGEERRGVMRARDFVGFYNGDPSTRVVAPHLEGEVAVVVGMGDVALDVARVLTRHASELEPTDIAEEAHARLKKSRLRQVVVVGRRGPDQVAFGEKGLDELLELVGVDVTTEKLGTAHGSAIAERLASLPASSRPAPRSVVLRFHAEPVEMIGRGEDGEVEGVRFEETELITRSGHVVSIPTGRTFVCETRLVIVAIGSEGTRLAGLPFDERTGTIPHERGRVLTAPGGTPLPGLYVTGWIKRGPYGLVEDNRACARETVERLALDVHTHPRFKDLPSEDLPGRLAARGTRLVSWDDFLKLDRHEILEGQAIGKVRRKLGTLAEALERLDQDRSQVRTSRHVDRVG